VGIGDGVLGIGDWAQSPTPNPQSPIPNPQSPIPNPQKELKITKIKNYKIFYYLLIKYKLINIKK